jgi:hypothetical protein
MVNAMLLNEFLREHDAFLEEQEKVRKLEAALSTVNERLKEQEEKIDTVSAAVVTNITGPQSSASPVAAELVLAAEVLGSARASPAHFGALAEMPFA